MLRRFASAYQRVQPLTIGELWAIPITLRIVLVENLRRLADDIVKCQAARQEADALADRVLEAGNHEAEPPDMVLRRVEKPLRTAFAVQLIQRLCDQDPKEVPALTWSVRASGCAGNDGRRHSPTRNISGKALST